MIKRLKEYFGHDKKRIDHALFVLEKGKEIARSYNTSNYNRKVLLASLIFHDVGIKKSEELYGYNNGKTQEDLGPEIAKKLISDLDFTNDEIRIIMDIIGNHHSKSRFDYKELEILKKSDLFVNRKESKHES